MATFPTVKNYIVTEKLGQGTYATVYKAYRTVSAIIIQNRSALFYIHTSSISRYGNPGVDFQ